MLQPPYLKQGDAVTIISTARKISMEELKPAVELLQSWGLVVNFGKNLFGEENQFSGSADERAQDLQAALDDKNCKAIICARGGYGTVQLIDKIDFAAFNNSPKWLVGYSDVTVLHNHINQNFEIETLHATMPVDIANNIENEVVKTLKKALFGERLSYEFTVEEESTEWEGTLKAPIVGGNLSILYSLTGTNSQISGKDKFIFMEDLDEYLYHIDRMMMNLTRTGLFEGCKGVLVGGMSSMNDNTIPYGKTAKEIIADRLNYLGVPVIFGVPSGHIKRNLSLIFNREVEVNRLEENKAKMTFSGRA